MIDAQQWFVCPNCGRRVWITTDLHNGDSMTCPDCDKQAMFVSHWVPVERSEK